MIVIPMAGMSSRFFCAGYRKPKYMLKIKDKTLFDISVESFSKYFKSEKFIFIVKNEYATPAFVESSVKFLGIKDYEIIVLDQDTKGQAETVSLGLDHYREYDLPVTIFNIDTFRPNFEFPDLESMEDGYLEVFRGSGSNWSYVQPEELGKTKINLTTEKKPISDLCCTGLYHFRTIKDYFKTYDYYLTLPEELWEKGELYVAPLYNYLIKNGSNMHYNLIERHEVIFCGTPDEYSELLV